MPSEQADNDELQRQHYLDNSVSEGSSYSYPTTPCVMSSPSDSAHFVPPASNYRSGPSTPVIPTSVPSSPSTYMYQQHRVTKPKIISGTQGTPNPEPTTYFPNVPTAPTTCYIQVTPTMPPQHQQYNPHIYCNVGGRQSQYPLVPQYSLQSSSSQTNQIHQQQVFVEEDWNGNAQNEMIIEPQVFPLSGQTHQGYPFQELPNSNNQPLYWNQGANQQLLLIHPQHTYVGSNSQHYGYQGIPVSVQNQQQQQCYN